MKKRDKGFTFIEIIVVMMIILIAAAAFTTNFTSMRESARNRASEKLIYCIDYGRAIAQISNYQTYLKFSYYKGGLYCDIYTEDAYGNKDVKDSIKICKDEYRLNYKVAEVSGYTELGSDDTITMAYNKATGGFKSDMNITNMMLDMFKQNEITIVKETGRAYKTYTDN